MRHTFLWLGRVVPDGRSAQDTEILMGCLPQWREASLSESTANPHVVKVMAEAGVDISKQYSKTLGDLDLLQFGYVVTTCGDANERCPLFPGKARVVHTGFDEPPKITKHLPDGEEKLPTGSGHRPP